MIMPQSDPPTSIKLGDTYMDTDGRCHVVVGTKGQEAIFEWLKECTHIHLTVEEAFAIVEVLDQHKSHDYVLNCLARQIEVQALAAKSNQKKEL